MSRNKREGHYAGKHAWFTKGKHVWRFTNGKARHHRERGPTTVHRREAAYIYVTELMRSK